MIIDLSSFLDGSDNFFSFNGELKQAESDLRERGTTIVGPIEYEGETFKVDGENAIEMRITFSYEESCSRCLKPSIHKVKTTLSGKLAEVQEGNYDEDSSYENDYDEVLYYEKDILDPKDYILNQVAISLPMKSLCNEDCKGLCISCGVDMNIDTCECIEENIDPRLEKLKNFFPKD